MDKISYIKNQDGSFSKTINQDKVHNIKEELDAIMAQIADMKAGTGATPEDQAKIDELILNYETAVVELKK